MEELASTRYWCRVCAQVVNPIIEVELKCPHCGRSFVAEMGRMASGQSCEFGPDVGSDRTLSLWAPVLLGMMGNLRGRGQARRLEFDEEDNNEEDDGLREDGETELVREIESIIRRRRRSSASKLQLLQGIRAGIGLNLGSLETDRDGRRDGDGDGGERVILINPFSQTIVLQGLSNDSHLAENDPNRYSTPPMQKEAVEALPTVKIMADVNVQCSVCLDEFDVGAEAKEMPCKHKFHCDCILPWLDAHSSCPVCRYQMPADESKGDPDDVSRTRIMRQQRDRVRARESTSTRDAPIYGRNREEMDRSGSSEYAGQMEGGSGPNSTGSTGGDADKRSENVRHFSLPWPFNSLFSSLTGSGNTQSTARNDHGSTSHREDS